MAPRGLARAALIVVVAGAALLVGSCSSAGRSPAPTGTPRPWGPAPTHDTRYVQIAGVRFTDNRDPVVPPSRHLAIDFTGGSHRSDDPCSADYAAITRIADGVLDVGVSQTYPAGATLPPSCELTNRWVLTVDLGETFTGGAWRDLSGPYLWFMVPPPGLVTVTGLPPGWELRGGGNFMDSPMGTWAQYYSPDPQGTDPARLLTLIQTFGGPVPAYITSGPKGGFESQQVKVGDANATLYRDSAHGVLTLVWRLGDDDLALMAYEQTFSVDALIDLAKSAKAAAS